eukprot:TRINITY_DN7175_c0_g8_i1.p2 TRINITY_DN7175_c0_g8~~TRINITY_DN7175_c0_g8_i1.p2  ORF type:complete len:473 (+),score=218.09 TRINITY_DN7175_c0_g8_i1:71-1420(+)
MAAALKEQCAALGVTELCFIRHANAAPLPSTAPVRTEEPHGWKTDDQKRPLTAKGKEQCDTATLWFSNLALKGAISSPARRASETAANMLGAHAATCELRCAAAVHPAGVNETCESLFETRGYGPLRKFFAVKEGEPAFREYADVVCKELAENLSAACTGNGKCVAVWGHAVFLNAIALLAAEACKASEETVASLLDMDLGETQGILLDIPTGTVSKKMVATEGGAKFINACAAGGVKKVVFVRHGNAAPAADDAPKRKDEPHHWKKSDQGRELTKQGEEQCAAAKAAWSGAMLKDALVLASPAKRAKATAQLMTAAEEPHIVESVHPAGINETCEALFEQMGYGKLRTFFEAEKGEPAFRDYANRVCADLAGAVPAAVEEAEEAGDAAGYVAVFGHAVFLNAIALEVLLAMSWTAETVDYLLDVDLGETEGILVDLASGKVEKHATAA